MILVRSSLVHSLVQKVGNVLVHRHINTLSLRSKFDTSYSIKFEKCDMNIT